jgi:tRNA threonylcarbamoyladenosine biosynthesis protein TsaB
VNPSRSSRALAVAIEASTRSPSIAIALGGEVLEERLAGDAPHASDLLPALERLLARLGAAPRDIANIVVGLGPGSYTGVRVGVATALGLARGSGAALRGVASMEALAWGELKPGQTGSVLLDARADELYFATYRRAAGGLEVLTAPCITTRAELPSLLVPGARLFADDDALRAADLATRTDLEIARDVAPRARPLLDLGLRRLELDGPHAPAQLEPLYLRAFAAKSRRR